LNQGRSNWCSGSLQNVFVSEPLRFDVPISVKYRVSAGGIPQHACEGANIKIVLQRGLSIIESLGTAAK
jgi:hypothetical protein